MAFVRLRLTDENGITKPTERQSIEISVEGGKLIACGSACPYYARSYQDSVCDTYYGEALAMIEVQGDVVVRGKCKAGQSEIMIKGIDDKNRQNDDYNMDWCAKAPAFSCRGLGC